MKEMKKSRGKNMTVPEIKRVLTLIDKSELTDAQIAEIVDRPELTVKSIRCVWKRAQKENMVGEKTGENVRVAMMDYRGLEKGPLGRAERVSNVDDRILTFGEENQIAFDDCIVEPKTLTGNVDPMEKILALMSGIMSGINQIIQMMQKEEE